jgi:uncharacterized protein YukE
VVRPGMPEITFEHKMRDIFKEKMRKKLEVQNIENLLNEVNDLKLLLERKERKEEDLKKAKAELISQNESIKSKLLSVSQDKQQLAEELKAVKAQLAKLKGEIDELSDELDSRDRKLNELFTRLSSEQYRCQELQDLMEEKDKAMEELQRKLSASTSKDSGGSSSASTSTIVGENANSVSSSNPHSAEFSFLPKGPTTASTDSKAAMPPPPPLQMAETFNASMRMGTTYFVKEDTAAFGLGITLPANNECFKKPAREQQVVEDLDDSGFLPPPPTQRRCLPFQLYESAAGDSLCASMFPAPKPPGPPVRPVLVATTGRVSSSAQENIPPPASFAAPQEREMPQMVRYCCTLLKFRSNFTEHNNDF